MSFGDEEILDTLREAVGPVPDAPPDRLERVVSQARRTRRTHSAWLVGAAAATTFAVSLGAVALRAPARSVRTAGKVVSIDVVKDAVAKTLKVNSGRLSVSYSVEGAGGLAALASMGAGGTAEFDVQRRVGQAKLNLGLMALGSESSLEFRVVDGVGYRRLRGFELDGAPNGKMWVQATLPGGGDAQAKLIDNVRGVIDDRLRELYAAVTEVRDVGGEDVRGTNAEHYAVTVDAAKVAGQDVPAGMPDTVIADVYIASGIVRRLHMRAPFDSMTSESSDSASECSTDSSNSTTCHAVPLESVHPAPFPTSPVQRTFANVTIELYDIGASINVEAPPAADVMSQTAYDALENRGFSSFGSGSQRSCAALPPQMLTSVPAAKRKEISAAIKAACERSLKASHCTTAPSPSPSAPKGTYVIEHCDSVTTSGSMRVAPSPATSR